MAIPNWGPLGHRRFQLRPACAKWAGRNLLCLPIENAFCARSGIFGFSGGSRLPKMMCIAFVRTLSHTQQFASRRTRGLLISWSSLNHSCHRQIDVPRNMRTLPRLWTGAVRRGGDRMHSEAHAHFVPIYPPRFLHRQSGGDSNTLAGCYPRNRGNLKRLRAC